MKRKLLVLFAMCLSVTLLYSQTPYGGKAQIIPGKVEAEYYDLGGEGVGFHDVDGVKPNWAEITFRPKDNVECESNANGRNVGGTTGGEWLVYTVDVKVAGKYQILGSFNAMAPIATAKMALKIDNDTVGKYNTSVGAIDWATYTVEAVDTVTLTAGTHKLNVSFATGIRLNFDYLNFVLMKEDARAPYLGVAQDIPGKIQAEFYDHGGSTVAYSDNNTVKDGDKTFRPFDLVDVETNANGKNVGWTQPDEWLLYTVNVKKAGTYQIKGSFNAMAPIGTGKLILKIDADTAGKYNTTVGAKDWATYTVEPVDTVTLTAGTHNLRVSFTASIRLNFDYLEFVPLTAGIQYPYMGKAQTIPGRIESEYYDEGGANVAWWDTDLKKSLTTFRVPDSVDVEANAFGKNVSWSAKNEWLKYTVDIDRADSFLLRSNINCFNIANGNFCVRVDGDSIGSYIGKKAVAWNTYSIDTLAKLIKLPAGRHELQIQFRGTNPQINIDYLEFINRSANHSADIKAITYGTAPGTPIAGVTALKMDYPVVLNFGTTAVPRITPVAAVGNATITKIDTVTKFPAKAEITITSESMVVSKNYSVTFTVDTDSTGLKDIKSDGAAIAGFSSVILKYSALYSKSIVPVITATPIAPKATVTITPAATFADSAVIAVTYKSKTKTYKVGFNPSTTNALLSSIKIGVDALATFKADTIKYSVVLPKGTTAVPAVTATTVNAKAKAVIVAAAALPGATVITVTAEDGTTKKVYTINFTVGLTATNMVSSSPVTIFPNPAQNELNIQAGSMINSVKLYNLAGVVVDQINNIGASTYKLQFNNAAKGVYFISVVTADGTSMQKFVIE